MSNNEVVWSSALDLAARIRQKDVSPVEVTEAILGRIEALNPRLNAFCLVAADQSRASALDAEVAVMKREPLGPLHGVPVSIKDVIFTRGLRTTGGSQLFADLVPEHDAVAVGRLRAAGAIVLGEEAACTGCSGGSATATVRTPAPMHASTPTTNRMVVFLYLFE